MIPKPEIRVSGEFKYVTTFADFNDMPAGIVAFVAIINLPGKTKLNFRSTPTIENNVIGQLASGDAVAVMPNIGPSLLDYRWALVLSERLGWGWIALVPTLTLQATSCLTPDTQVNFPPELRYGSKAAMWEGTLVFAEGLVPKWGLEPV